MRLTEIGRVLRMGRTQLNNLARLGKFKTAKKVKENHAMVWMVDDKEAKQFINSRQHETK